MVQTCFTQSARRLAASYSDLDSPSRIRLTLTVAGVLMCLATPAFAQSNPWESAVSALQTSMTGPIAKGCSLVAIVVGGLMFAFGEGGSKKMLSGIIFGLGMALGAANFMTWLFPTT
jgi:type IV secretory pathway VirB2 component (pilin)